MRAGSGRNVRLLERNRARHRAALQIQFDNSRGIPETAPTTMTVLGDDDGVGIRRRNERVGTQIELVGQSSGALGNLIPGTRVDENGGVGEIVSDQQLFRLAR